jgi:hypothetical protein
MSLITITNRDKKMIIWNFMEELWNNYKNAAGNGLPTKFILRTLILLEYLTNFCVEMELVNR